MRAFVLEDDEGRISLFEQVLKGHELTVARNIWKARKMFVPPFDIILLDHDLGGRQMISSEDENTGYSFVRWLGEAPKGAQPPVIVHSYNPDGADAMVRLLQDNGWVAASKMPFGPTLLNMLEALHNHVTQ